PYGFPTGEDPAAPGPGRCVRRGVRVLVVPPSLRGRQPRIRALARGVGDLAARLRGAPGGTATGGPERAVRPAGGAGGGGARHPLPRAARSAAAAGAA